jgi:hypothetical protein
MGFSLGRNVWMGDSERVAGGNTMSMKTSTAALASFRRGLSPTSAAFRATRKFSELSRSNHRPAETNQPTKESKEEPTMITANAPQNFPRRGLTAAIPVILRITLSLFLWTLGVSAMDIRLGQTQPKSHRVVINFPVNQAQAQDLQRWVNAGHDPWCRDPQLVAAAALQRISPEFSNVEPASLPLELENNQKTKAVYTFHSLDGHTTYRVTLRRYRFLLSTAGSLRQIIWIPESAEIVSRDTRD